MNMKEEEINARIDWLKLNTPDYEKEGYIHIGKGSISVFAGVVDCDKVQSFNPILSDRTRMELKNFLGANFKENLDDWEGVTSGAIEDYQDWRGGNSVAFRISDIFTIPEHKERWDGVSPCPKFAKENVEMPLFNVFDGGNGDGLVTIAEHKGIILIEGTLWEKDGCINVWVNENFAQVK